MNIRTRGVQANRKIDLTAGKASGKFIKNRANQPLKELPIAAEQQQREADLHDDLFELPENPLNEKPALQNQNGAIMAAAYVRNAQTPLLFLFNTSPRPSSFGEERECRHA
jgi:hypothetical protein